LVSEVGDSNCREMSWDFRKEKIQRKQESRNYKRNGVDRGRDELDSRRIIRRWKLMYK